MSFPVMATVSVVDVSTLRVAASCLTTGTTVANCGIAINGCKQQFYSTNAGYGQLLDTAASAAFFAATTNARVIAYDPVNSRIAVLTTAAVLEINPANWQTAWTTNHGLTLGTSGVGIDVDRNGNVAITAAGTIQVYDGATGVMSSTAAQAGAATCRFDADSNLYVAGTALIKYGSGLVQDWTAPLTFTAISVGDQFVYGEADTGTGSLVDIVSPVNGGVLATTATLSSPCAIPGGRLIALSNSLGISGPIITLVNSGGFVSAKGDRLSGWASISGTGPTYGRSGPTLAEPSVGRIGAFAW